MSVCEECWGAAYTASRFGTESHVEAYYRLLDENPHGHDVTIGAES